MPRYIVVLCWTVTLVSAQPVVVFDDDPTPGDGALETAWLQVGYGPERGFAPMRPDDLAEVAMITGGGFLPIITDRPYHGREATRLVVTSGAIGWWSVEFPLADRSPLARAEVAEGRLVLAVRGHVGGERFDVGLRDRATPRHSVRLPLSRYGPVADSWTIYRIPINDFISVLPALDLTRLGAVQLHSAGRQGVGVDLDFIRLELGGDPAAVTYEVQPHDLPAPVPSAGSAAPAVATPVVSGGPTASPTESEPSRPVAGAPSVEARPAGQPATVSGDGPLPAGALVPPPLPEPRTGSGVAEGGQPVPGDQPAAPRATTTASAPVSALPSPRATRPEPRVTSPAADQAAGQVAPGHGTVAVAAASAPRPHGTPSLRPSRPQQPVEPEQPAPAQPTQPVQAQPPATGPPPDRPTTAAPAAEPGAPAPSAGGEAFRPMATVSRFYIDSDEPGHWPASGLRAAFATNQGERALDPEELVEYFAVSPEGRLPLDPVDDPLRTGLVVRIQAQQAGFAWWVAQIGREGWATADEQPHLRNGRLEFAIKGEQGGETLRIGLVDDQEPPQMALVPLERHAAVTTDWQIVRLPLRLFRVANPSLNWARVKAVVVASAHGRPFTIWLDNIRVVMPVDGRD